MRALTELRDPWALLIAALAGVTAVALTAPWQVAAGVALAVLAVRVAAGSLVATAPMLALPAPQLRLPGRTDYGSGPGGRITRAEATVAELVAAGLRNRDIADRLVVSERTVDNHVSHILTKLDFHSRAQIAAWWTERHVSTRK
jgi:DNA-binding NarL/FixJ family response regulator